jgi:outer membrane biosynthesis protein TonB
MLHAFISSSSDRPRRATAGGLTLSVVTHASLIAAAIVATTASPVTSEELRNAGAVVERAIFANATTAARGGGARRMRPHRRARLNTAVDPTTPVPAPLLAELPALLEIDVPTIDLQGNDLAERASADVDFSDGSLSRVVGATFRKSDAKALPNGAYAADAVEKIVLPVPGNPRPRYPDFLAGAGVEGNVDVSFVVDSAGKIEPHSLSIVHAPHRLFAAAVRSALLHSRFMPAEIDGRPVPQLVSQRFSFVMAR